MGRGKSTYIHEPFEGKSPRGSWTTICHDMQASEAWAALNLRQQGLYLHLKSKFRVWWSGKGQSRRKVRDNARDISLPAQEARTLYGNLATFRADMDRLIECGFLDCVTSGFNTRTASIYGFSGRWQSYGTEGYEVPKDVMRPGALRRAKQD